MTSDLPRLSSRLFNGLALLTVAIPVVVVLVALIIPFSGVKFGGINETYLPPAQQTRQAQDEFNEEFPAFRTDPVKLVVTGADNQQLVDIVMQTRQVEGLAGPADTIPPRGQRVALWAIQRIGDSPLEQIIFTDTVPLSPAAQACGQLRVINTDRLFGEAIARIHRADSLSSLFV